MPYLYGLYTCARNLELYGLIGEREMREMSISRQTIKVSITGITNHRIQRSTWESLSVCGFAGSGMFFLIGMMVSLLSFFGAVARTKIAADAIVVLLLTAFLLAFLGAHSLDKLERS